MADDSEAVVRRRMDSSSFENKGFQQEDVDEYRVVFNYFDKEGKGAITSKQLATVLRSLKPIPNEAFVQKQVEKINANMKGECDFTNFLECLHTTIRATTKKVHRKTIYTTISEERKNEIRDAFEMFDDNNDGTISVDELQTVMASCGIYTTEDEARDILTEFSTNEREDLDFEEFLTLMTTKESGELNSDIMEAFQFFDKDGDGIITADEIRTVMHALGENISEEDIHEMITEADSYEQGGVCYQDFLNMMTGN